MSAFHGFPQFMKGRPVLVHPDWGELGKIIAAQYNPDTLTRTLQSQAIKESGDRSEPLRLMGRSVETIKRDANIDSKGQLPVKP